MTEHPFNTYKTYAPFQKTIELRTKPTYVSYNPYVSRPQEKTHGKL